MAGKHAAPSPSKREVQDTKIQGIALSDGCQDAKKQLQSQRASKPSKPKKAAAKRRLLIIVCTLLVVLFIGYGSGVAFFCSHAFPRTELFKIDISYASADTIDVKMDEVLTNYKLKITGEGFFVTLDTDQLGLLKLDKQVARLLIEQQNAWAWPVEVLFSHKPTLRLVEISDSQGIRAILEEPVNAYNAQASPTKDATLSFNKETQSFEIVPEAYGTALDLQAVTSAVSKAVSMLAPELTLTPEVIEKPQILSENSELKAALDKANCIVKSPIKINYKGQSFEVLKADTLASALRINGTTLELNEEWLTHFVDAMAGRLNTQGATRTIHRPDGKVYTIKGGSYGWILNKSKFKAALERSILSAQPADIELEFTSTAQKLPDANMVDFTRYVDVDLTEQIARFYDASGAIIWQAPIVSGRPGQSATPQGIFTVNRKQSPTKLIGRIDPATGKPEYEAPVRFWMPFVGNSVGFHDAPWQASFGGNRYITNGSHGCINLSPSAAQSLYGVLSQGDVVVVHS